MFTGVARADRGGETVFAEARGFAHRAYGVANTLETRFALASGTKGFTAATVFSLIDSGLLTEPTTVRSVLGEELPQVHPEVTVGHLLRHTSGIGDYCPDDEDPPPGQCLLASTADYLAAMAGLPAVSAPGAEFRYNNGGYVVLGAMAERVTGTVLADLVQERVCVPAGLRHTGFLRTDALPGDAATGYLPDGRTNALEVPVHGHGDGGLYSTVGDVHAFWPALMGGRIVASPERMLADGCGFWPVPGGFALQGGDAGINFRSVHLPDRDITCTVIANAGGVMAMSQHLADLVAAP
ncbi:serine hydrolase domain-containing protein [Amycolatopsis magusensis]|uniref:serine hydrolase domain-containing protein n=1 Tax=Amycolatopsis magusensis TaxID=882444 RepID=UPI003C2F3F14